LNGPAENKARANASAHTELQCSQPSARFRTLELEKRGNGGPTANAHPAADGSAPSVLPERIQNEAREKVAAPPAAHLVRIGCHGVPDGASDARVVPEREGSAEPWLDGIWRRTQNVYAKLGLRMCLRV
jgi:hypothetical protein